MKKTIQFEMAGDCNSSVIQYLEFAIPKYTQSIKMHVCVDTSQTDIDLLNIQSPDYHRILTGIFIGKKNQSSTWRYSRMLLVNNGFIFEMDKNIEIGVETESGEGVDFLRIDYNSVSSILLKEFLIDVYVEIEYI